MSQFIDLLVFPAHLEHEFSAQEKVCVCVCVYYATAVSLLCLLCCIIFESVCGLQ